MNADAGQGAVQLLHGDDDAHHRRQDTEAGAGLAGAMQGVGGLEHVFLHHSQFMLQQGVELVGRHLAHAQQTEVVGDEGQQQRVFLYQGIAEKHRALPGRLYMFVQPLETTHLHLVQQVMHQGQQLPVDLVLIRMLADQSLQLILHLQQHLLGVADDHGTTRRPQDDQHLRGLPQGQQPAAGHHEAAKHADQHHPDPHENLHLSSSETLCQTAVQMGQALLVQLTDPRFGEIQHQGDLLHVQLMLVIQ